MKDLHQSVGKGIVRETKQPAPLKTTKLCQYIIEAQILSGSFPSLPARRYSNASALRWVCQVNDDFGCRPIRGEFKVGVYQNTYISSVLF